MNAIVLPSDIEEIARRLAEPAQDLAGKTVLLTGGRGFLGRYFTEVILELNRTILKEPLPIGYGRQFDHRRRIRQPNPRSAQCHLSPARCDPADGCGTGRWTT